MRRPRLRIRTLLVLVGIAATLCGLHARRVRKTSLERAVGAAVWNEGGSFNRDVDMDDDWNGATPWYPAWLVRLVGEDYLTSIDAVVLAEHQDADRVLPTVARLSRLRLLKLPACRVTDGGLATLTGLRRLRWLELAATPTTDVGLRRVAGIHSIEILDLRNTAVTDDGVRALASMPRLKRVLLHGTKVTPGRLQRLRAELPGCTIDGETGF